MNTIEMENIIKEITYKPNWRIQFDFFDKYIQLQVYDCIDAVTGKHTDWKSGKVYLSKHMCKQEIVGAVFGLIERAELHEMKEFFRYKGRAIYNPHFDPDKLVDFASDKDNFNCRTNSMTMIED